MTTNPNKALWEKGDFTQLSRHMRIAGAAFVERLGINPDMTVLDLGCGDGTTAVPIAQRGATVTGIDIAENLVAAGKARAAAADLNNLAFRQGDASDLADVPDETFDLVVSMFGAMFAPRPYDVASEMFRVTKHGGRIVMGNWIPDDPTLVAQVLKTSAAFTPPPPEGFISPMLWGREDEVRARFVAAGAAGSDVVAVRDNYRFDYPGTPSAFVALFLNYYGPSMNALEAAESAGRGAEFRRALITLFESQNRSSNPSKTEADATFLRVTVAKR